MAFKGGGLGWGPQFPLRSTTKDGLYGLVKTIKAEILQNLKILFLTSPGEKLHHPNFGIGMRRFLFENDTPALHGTIKNKITKQVQIYMPSIRATRIDILSALNSPSVPENDIVVVFEFYIKPLNIFHTLAIKSAEINFAGDTLPNFMSENADSSILNVSGKAF